MISWIMILKARRDVRVVEDRHFSYCAFSRAGCAHCTLTARRLRQHPQEFGRAATCVETADLPDIEQLSLRFLRAINFYGLAEVEFKQDPRDGLCKLLDVNAWAWGFNGLDRQLASILHISCTQTGWDTTSSLQEHIRHRLASGAD
jgi:predicted ATP-grasp superfamily ATP-dependent carboligase